MEPHITLLRPGTVIASTARNVAMLCSFVHRSLAHLDLSFSEYSRNIKAVTTEEELRKMVVKKTRTMYTLNLDSSSHFNRRLQKVEVDSMCPRDSLYVRYICVRPKVYYEHLERSIFWHLCESKDQLKDLKKCLRAIEMTGLCVNEFRGTIFMVCLYVLIKNRAESSLVIEVLRVCGPNMTDLIMQLRSDSGLVLEYFLIHSRIMKFNFGNMCPLTKSIHDGLLHNVTALLSFGYRLQIPLSMYAVVIHNFLPAPDGLQWAPYTLRENGTKHRILLLLQLMNLHSQSKNNLGKSTECLRQLWRSYPDCYFEQWEVLNALRYTSDEDFAVYQSHLNGVWKFYSNALMAERDFSSSIGQPRGLAHYCRCRVRGLLKDNWEMPFGMDRLGMSRYLVSYLKLES